MNGLSFANVDLVLNLCRTLLLGAPEFVGGLLVAQLLLVVLCG